MATGTREWYAEIPSTQDRAVALARAGAEEGTRVVAGRQRSGRGRHGHSWESPEGGLYLSIVLRAPEDRTTLLPIALSAVLASELGHLYSVPLRIRWPNDLLVVAESSSARKLGGVLVDEVVSPTLRRAWVAGIGINVSTDRVALPPEVRSRAAVLSELSRSPPVLEEVEALVVRATLQCAAKLRRAEGRLAVRELARRLLWGVGRAAFLDGSPAGTIVGLGDEGELWVEVRGIRKAFYSGVLEVGETPP